MALSSSVALRPPNTPWASRSAKAAFTLVELLVTIGLIAVLTGLTALGIVRARDRAGAVKCLSNLHQIGNNIADTRVRNRLGFYSPVVVGGRSHVVLPATRTRFS
jgi:prepilin-type N-terminal cleavage/methylation domain-containing protein